MEIPWVLRTDNDVSKITVEGAERRNLAGINRCLDLLGLQKHDHADINTTAQSLVQSGYWQDISNQINPHNTFMSKVDLEDDLAHEMPTQLLAYTGKTNAADAIKYMAVKKAIRMRGFLKAYNGELNTLSGGELAKPLLRSLKIAQGVI